MALLMIWCKQDPWATNNAGERLFPQFPLEKPDRPYAQVAESSSVDSASSLDSSHRLTYHPEATATPPKVSSTSVVIPRYTLPQYSFHLPTIDQSKSGEPFFTHLQDSSIIAGYDDSHFFCWCHVAKDTERGVYPGSHGKLHADARVDQGQGQGPRYRMSMFFEHAKSCSFYKVSGHHCFVSNDPC